MGYLLSVLTSTARRAPLVALLGAGLAFTATQVASAQPILQNQLLSKAPPDECFDFIGATDNFWNFGNPVSSSICGSRTLKVNQAYVWGLTKSGSTLYFGTAANVQCLVIGFIGLSPSTGFKTPSYVCEGMARTATPPPLIPGVPGDWRPPKIYSFDLVSNTRADLSSNYPTYLNQTLGIRSAGSKGGLAILAGPALDPMLGICFFTTDGTNFREKCDSRYTDIRQWVTFNGDLYFGVQSAGGAGRILHWLSTDTSSFNYEEVGATDAEVAYLTVDTPNNRMYVTTWGGANTGNPNPLATPTGLWVSPQTPASPPKLTSGDLNNWTKIWDTNDYEVDPVTGASLVGGAVQYYQGQIYWGLMQVPLTGFLAWERACMCMPTTQQTLTAIVNTTRPIPIFRYDPTSQKTQLLYGDATLHAYQGGKWVSKPNNAGKPLYGPAGFGNRFNTYTWAGAVYENRLYFGTFDWSYLLADGLVGVLLGNHNITPSLLGSAFGVGILTSALNQTGFGADLWRFDSPNKPAKAESKNGLGNYLNYGIRTMVSDDRLYVGTANPMNLKTMPSPQLDGGWELRALGP
jgi:hypothetical protein